MEAFLKVSHIIVDKYFLLYKVYNLWRVKPYLPTLQYQVATIMYNFHDQKLIFPHFQLRQLKFAIQIPILTFEASINHKPMRIFILHTDIDTNKNVYVMLHNQ